MARNAPTSESRLSHLAWRAVWTVVPAVAVLPFVVARLPPLYDYYHWLFVGKLVAERFSTGPLREVVGAAYRLVPLPVPDLAAPVALGLLNLWLTPETAGRVLAAAGVVLFGLAFAFFVRTLQERPTAIELLGFPWALGYFLYKGFLSFFVSLPVAFFGLALLHRSTRGAEQPMGRRALLGFSALATALYLGHIMAWAVLGAGCAVYALVLAQRRHRAAALRLGATFGPSVVLLLVWLVLGLAIPHERQHTTGGAGAPGRASSPFGLYDSPADKLRSVVQPLLLFMRTDPLRPPFSIFGANLVLLLALAIVVGGGLDRPLRAPPRPMLLLAAALAAVALFTPLADLPGMGRPDERFVLPALFATLGALRWRRRTAPQAALAGGVVLALLGLHVIEYGRAGRDLERLAVALRQSVPAGAPVLSLTVLPPTVGPGCDEHSAVSIGTPALKWFGVIALLETNARRVNLMDTTAIQRRSDPPNQQDLRVLVRARDELARDLRSQAEGYTYVEIFGCATDFGDAARRFSPDFAAVAAGDHFMVLRRADPPIEPMPQ